MAKSINRMLTNLSAKPKEDKEWLLASFISKEKQASKRLNEIFKIYDIDNESRSVIIADVRKMTMMRIFIKELKKRKNRGVKESARP